MAALNSDCTEQQGPSERGSGGFGLGASSLEPPAGADAFPMLLRHRQVPRPAAFDSIELSIPVMWTRHHLYSHSSTAGLAEGCR